MAFDADGVMNVQRQWFLPLQGRLQKIDFCKMFDSTFYCTEQSTRVLTQSYLK